MLSNMNQDAEDGFVSGIVNGFLDKTLGTFVKYDCMEMMFLKGHTDGEYLYRVRTFVCSSRTGEEEIFNQMKNVKTYE